MIRRIVPHLALLVAVLLPGGAAALQHAIIPYTSSVDGVTLWMVVIYPDGAQHRPMLAVMHGYSGNMYDVYPTMEFLADRGLFTVGPAMRGRNNSGGSPDDSAWELMDIRDAIEAAEALYPAETDPGNINIVGYSGGGGNTFGCMSKFPDTFRLAAAFFGMSDYGYDLVHGWYHYGGDGCCQDILRQRIGGAPEEVPDAYRARSSLLAVRNCRYTTFQMYVDAEETLCPVYNDTTYLRRALELGYSNVSLNLSRPGDQWRWFHGYPNQIPDLVQAFDYFVPGILAGAYPVPRLDRSGEQSVLGYIETAPYRVVLGDGRSEVAELAYDVSGDLSSEESAWRFELASRTGTVDSLELTVRRLARESDYVVEDEDLTHGTMSDTLLRTDAAGTLRYESRLDTVSVIRFFRDPAAAPASGRAARDGAPRSGVLTASPNPCAGVLRIRWDRMPPTSSGGASRIPGGVTDRADAPRIFDSSGRLVALLRRPPLIGDRFTEWTWDGTLRTGGKARAGWYFIRLPGSPELSTRALLVH